MKENKETEGKVVMENKEEAEKVQKEYKESMVPLLDEKKEELGALMEKQKKEDIDAARNGKSGISGSGSTSKILSREAGVLNSHPLPLLLHLLCILRGGRPRKLYSEH